MGQGRRQKGAALLLNMPINTIHAHANHIYPKLGVHRLEDALDKVFGKYACAYACARKERERERESRGKADRERGPR